MTKRVKRKASSVSFSLSRWFRKISSARPSSLIFVIIVIAFTSFLLAGGLLTLINQPPITIYVGGRFFFIATRELYGGSSALDGQLGGDTIVSALLYVFGLVGLLLTYGSTRNAYKPRQAYMAFIVGVTLIVISYLFLESVIFAKTG